MWTSLLALSFVPLAACVRNLVVFGDSYSDTDNFQRWSNGPLWSENVAAGYNAKLHSFAYSGAVCDSAMFANTTEEELTASIVDQVEMYYKLNLDMDPKDTVFAFWTGTSDIHHAFQLQPTLSSTPDMNGIVECISSCIKTIRRLFHAERFIVFNTMPLEHMPYFRDTPLAESRKTAAHELNRLLQKDIISLNKHVRALELDLVDVHALLSDMVTNPDAFGFTNGQDAYSDQTCLDGPCANVNEFVWWDRTHLTAAAHRAIANSILLAGSFAPETSVRADVNITPYRSPIYVAPPHENGTQHATEAQKNEPPKSTLQDEDTILNNEPISNGDYSTSMSRKSLALLTLVILTCIVLVVFAKRRHHGLTSLFTRPSRGKFSPVRTSDGTEN